MWREIPALYDVARDTCHAFGLPWTDPRTCITYPPPGRRTKGRHRMPMLTKVERVNLLGPHGGRCRTCHQPHVRQYCRSCDEFFYECQCADRPHVGHRTYRWVAGTIIADPDFDDRQHTNRK